MVNCALKCFKWVLFALTFLQFVLSVALVITCWVILSNVKVNFIDFDSLNVPSFSKAGVIVFLVVNVLWATISFFGCCGAAKESSWMLKTFASINLIFVVLNIIAYALVGGLWGKLQPEIEKGLYQAVEGYEQNQTLSNAIDDIQRNLHCCGVNNVNDWKTYETNHKSLPASCCGLKEGDCKRDSEQSFKQSCMSALDISHIWVWLLVDAGLSIAIPLMLVIGTCCLANALKREYEVV